MLIFFLTFLNSLLAQEQASLPTPSLSFLKGSEFQNLMETLSGKQYGYTKAQLAEIGGQSVAEYILYLSRIDVPLKRVIFIIGQDFQGSTYQNGYFGLAAARYLAQRKVEVDVVLLYPNDPLRSRLAMQCKSHSATLHFDILQNLQEQLNVQMTKNILANWLNDYDLVIDAITLSSIEQPKTPIREFMHAFSEVNKKVLAINLPVGWHTDNGNLYNVYVPQFVISLGLPLKGIKEFEGQHAIGGRYIPQTNTFNYVLPKYKIEDHFHVLQK
ncbi:unnamed protein product [Paramecium sonneborni]|uniref:NAD(P)H-hydrate epimerase n=1 Tax=Paramecium sonneborni TaxID=65129 RepID=A0A8S1PRU6_9CILI|nr:unnamed protein product [Paramecium sonneborni]